MNTSRSISPRHARELVEESAIPLDFAEKNGVYTETSPDAIHAILDPTSEKTFWADWSKKYGDCLVFPYPNIDGFARLKPTNPRSRGEAPEVQSDHAYGPPPTDQREPIKYEAPSGSGLHIYVPVGQDELLADATVPLIIVEGEKKALSLAAQANGRYAVVGISGVTCWHDVKHRIATDEYRLNPELARYVLPGRQVTILFDQPDMLVNAKVISAAANLARVLYDVIGDFDEDDFEASVQIAYVDSVSGAKKTGVDDLVAHLEQTRKRLVGEGASKARIESETALRFNEQPARPDLLLAFLSEQIASGDLEAREKAVLFKRAATWLRVWHKAPSSTNPWRSIATKLANIFGRESRDADAAVEHLDIAAARDTESKDPYESFGDDKHLKYTVPALTKQFRLYRDQHGVAATYNINERCEATLLAGDDPLRKHLHDLLTGQFAGKRPPRKLLYKAIELWQLEATPMKQEPQPFTFADDHRVTFKKFDWVPLEGVFPTWREFLVRLSDAKAFCAYVWSAFESANKSRQFVWLVGDGQDGKSAVLGVLADVFDTACASITGQMLRNANQFTTSMLYAKRIAVYADCKDPTFPMREFVRNATSNDPVPIERKHQDVFMGRVYVKLFVAANCAPALTSQASDMSRLILIHVAESMTKDDPTFPTRLHAELPQFLEYCRKVYQELCPNHGNIRVADATEELKAAEARETERDFETAFERYFVVDAESRLRPSDVIDVLKWHGIKDSLKHRDFKEWLKRNHRIVMKSSQGRDYYPGIRLRDLDENKSDDVRCRTKLTTTDQKATATPNDTDNTGNITDLFRFAQG